MLIDKFSRFLSYTLTLTKQSIDGAVTQITTNFYYILLPYFKRRDSFDVVLKEEERIQEKEIEVEKMAKRGRALLIKLNTDNV